MLSLIQSQRVVLTEDEMVYFKEATLDDLYKYQEYVKARREQFKIFGQTEEFDVYHAAKTYSDPIGDTPFRVGCRLLVEIVSKHVDNKNALLLDVGAGSGYLGAEAKRLGFLNIDALEPSQAMIDKQPKDLFGKVFQEFLKISKPCSIPADTYDCVMSNGSVYSGHIEVEAFQEILRIVKPGGFVVFNISDFWCKYNDFGTRLDVRFQTDLESGKLKTVVKERTAYFYPLEDATVYVLQKSCETKDQASLIYIS